MTTQLKKTAKHTAIYAIASTLRRLTGIVMLPIYTRYMTPVDYGVVELLSMAIEIAGILIGLRISQAMFRYYILAEGEAEKKAVVSTVLITIMLSSSFGSLVLYGVADKLAEIIFGNAEYVFELQLFAFTLLANAVVAVGLSYLRARQAPMLFVAASVASLLIQVCLNIIFVVLLEMHVTGVVYSALISSFVIAITLSIFVFYKVGFHYSSTIANKIIKFVAPLILASIGGFYVAYADKYFLRLFGGLHDVGLYSLAGRISSVLVTVSEAVNMSWGADRFEIVKKENAKIIYEQIFRYFSLMMTVFAAGLALFANDFLQFMTNPDFYPAGNVVPILVLAVLIQINTVFCNFGIIYHEKTGIIAQAIWLKAAVSTIGCIVLIPIIGAYGAAITLVMANIVEFIWVYLKATNLYDMGLKWRPVMIAYGVAILCVGCGILFPVGKFDYFLYRVVIFLFLLCVIFILPIWSIDERKSMRNVFTKLQRKKS